MAVYTQVNSDQVRAFIAGYDIGALETYVGIADGVENTNYLLFTGSGRYILTLYEKRVAEGDLPYFLDLMDHLSRQGIPCPVPLHDRMGNAPRPPGGPTGRARHLSGGHCPFPDRTRALSRRRTGLGAPSHRQFRLREVAPERAVARRVGTNAVPVGSETRQI